MHGLAAATACGAGASGVGPGEQRTSCLRWAVGCWPPVA